jgi:hypothetical protein
MPLRGLGTIPGLTPFPPGRQRDNIAIDLGPSWELKTSQDARRPREVQPEKLRLTGGKHTIRVAFTATAAKNAPGNPVRAVSNPVVIEVISAKEIAARPKRLKSQKNAFELRLAYHGPRDNPNQAGVDPIRSLILHTTLVDYDLPHGWSAVPISQQQAARIIDHLRVEGSLVDALPFTDDRPPPPLDGPAYSLTVKGPDKLVLYKPVGWGLGVLDFIERLRTVLDGEAAKAADEMMAVLEPQRKQWEAVAKWGQAVEGVQVRLRAKKPKWTEGVMPQFSADVRNLGTRNLLVYRAARFWTSSELEIDGRWYRRALPKHGYRPPLSDLVPGRQFDKIFFDLGRGWYLADSPSQDAGETGVTQSEGRLKLAPGKHTIRVAPTMPLKGDRPGDHVRAISNPVEIEIVAKSDEKVGATQQGNASVTASEPTVEATGVKPDDRTPPVRPVSSRELDGEEVLKQLKSFDAVYEAAFTASGKRSGGPVRKWNFTMFRGRIALEEEVVEITEADIAKRRRLGPPGGGEGKPMLALRSTFFVGPTAQTKYDWVGIIQRYGPQDPWPENGPGPATAGSLDVVDPDSPAYMLQIKRTLWCLGRGYSKHITKIRDVSPQKDGRLKVAADGLDMALRPGAKWELVIDPDAEYLVRSAELVDNRDRRSSYTNSGLRRHGSHCVPERGECQGAFINASFEFQSASFEADVEFLRRAKATMQPPYLIHTDVSDQRRTPELYMPYDAGKMSPKGSEPDFDLDWEKEAVFDMEEVPTSEPKLRAVIGRTFTPAVARKGEIKIHGRQYTALLAQVGTTTESFDRPETILLLTAADDPRHFIQSYEKHLGAIRTVDGKYYKISATPTGDKLTVTPCGDNVGVLQVGAGGRDVERREVWGGVLLSKEGAVPLGNFYYPVPAEDLGQRRIPVGDYAPQILFVHFGNVHLSLRPNGPPPFNVKIRKDKPFTLNFAAKGNLRLTSPRATQTFKPGSSVPLVAVIVDPELNLQVCASDTTQKVNKRTYTYAAGEKFTTTSCTVSQNPTVVIRDSSGKQVTEATMPYC